MVGCHSARERCQRQNKNKKIGVMMVTDQVSHDVVLVVLDSGVKGRVTVGVVPHWVADSL